MNKSELIERINGGSSVILSLDCVKVVSIKRDVRQFNRWAMGSVLKIVAVHPEYGPIWFSTSGSKFWDINLHDTISLKVKVTGVGEPSKAYPDPILFSKPIGRGENSVKIHEIFPESIDSSVNL